MSYQSYLMSCANICFDFPQQVNWIVQSRLDLQLLKMHTLFCEIRSYPCWQNKAGKLTVYNVCTTRVNTAGIGAFVCSYVPSWSLDLKSHWLNFAQFYWCLQTSGTLCICACAAVYMCMLGINESVCVLSGHPDSPGLPVISIQASVLILEVKINSSNMSALKSLTEDYTRF